MHGSAAPLEGSTPTRHGHSGHSDVTPISRIRLEVAQGASRILAWQGEKAIFPRSESGTFRHLGSGNVATDPLPDSPRVDHRWPRMVRGRCPEPVANHRVGNGGQGRNRTSDTRIFSSSESAVRCEKVEDREGVFVGPTEPSALTEPMPSPDRGDRPSRAVSSRTATASVHRDRTRTEPGTSRPAFGREGDQSDSCRNTRMSCAVASSCRWLFTVVSKSVKN